MSSEHLDLFELDYEDLVVTEDIPPIDTITKSDTEVMKSLSDYAAKDETWIIYKNKDGRLSSKLIEDLFPEEFADWAIDLWPALKDTKHKLLAMNTQKAREMIFESILGAYCLMRDTFRNKMNMKSSG
jgi:hypothetical protein